MKSEFSTKCDEKLTASTQTVVREIANLSKETKVVLNQDQVRQVLNLLPDALKNLIVEGYRGANISTFMTMIITEEAQREFRNPKNGEPVIRKAGLLPRFRVSKPWRKGIMDTVEIDSGAENQNAIIAVATKNMEKRKEYKAKAEARKAAAAAEAK